jgi:hypothetical protein
VQLQGGLTVSNRTTNLSAGASVSLGLFVSGGLTVSTGGLTVSSGTNTTTLSGGLSVNGGTASFSNTTTNFTSTSTTNFNATSILNILTSNNEAPTAAARTSTQQIATTAFVQKEIGVASYYIKTLAGNQNLPDPKPTLCITGFSSFDFFDPIIIRLSASYQTNLNTNTTTGTLPYYDIFYSPYFAVFPKAFITQSLQTVYFLNNGILSSTSNKTYTYSNGTYLPNGRPTWANGIVDANGVASLLPFTTLNDGTTAQMIFNVYSSATAPLPASPSYNHSIDIEILNYGRFSPSNVYTTGFNMKNINA